MKQLLLAVAAAFLAGCGTDARLAGAPGTWSVGDSAVTEIGQLEGDSSYQLFRVRDIVALTDGSIALVNSGTSELRVYGADGRFLRAMGRQGEGPGEFSMLFNLVRRGDTLCAFDWRLGRLTRFLVSGEYLDDISLRTGASMITPTFAGLLADGSAVGWVDRLVDELPNGFIRSNEFLVHVRPGQGVDTLGEFPGREANVRSTQPKPGSVVMSVARSPFNRDFLATAGGDRIYAAPNDSAVIYAWNGAGAPVDTLRWDEAPQRLDDAMVAAFAERDTRGLDAAAAAARRRSMLENPRPATAPVFDRLLLGPDGELWVRRLDDPRAPASEWLVFDDAGELRARVAIPHEREIRAVTADRVYTLERDEYDVEYVRAYPLRR